MASEYHVDNGRGRARCGAACEGMYLVEREARATCATCVEVVDGTEVLAHHVAFKALMDTACGYSKRGKDVVLFIEDQIPRKFHDGSLLSTDYWQQSEDKPLKKRGGKRGSK